MKNNVKSANIFVNIKSKPPKNLNTHLTKFPQILPRCMDAAHRGSVVFTIFSYCM